MSNYCLLQTCEPPYGLRKCFERLKPCSRNPEITHKEQEGIRCRLVSADPILGSVLRH